jgi:aspartyl protease family protein
MLEKLALIATVGAGVAIGLFWPTTHRSAVVAGGLEVVIARSSDLHYYADAGVNGRQVHFMIDTGASEVALTEADAKAAGIAVDPDKYEVIGDGASGMVRGQYVQLKTLELGGMRQKDVKAVVVPGASVSLLGQPFLDKIDEIVIRDGEMRLKEDAGS